MRDCRSVWPSFPLIWCASSVPWNWRGLRLLRSRMLRAVPLECLSKELGNLEGVAPFNISAACCNAPFEGAISESFCRKPIGRALHEQCDVAILPGSTMTATPRFAIAVRIAMGRTRSN